MLSAQKDSHCHLSTPMDFRGKWVLITGASAGLGREMARQLAVEHGAHLVLSARRAERLEALKSELESQGAQVVCLTGDLSKPDELERILSEATDGRQLYGAILNAGVTYFGLHFELSQQKFLSMLQLNVIANVHMTTELVRHMARHAMGGGVMLVSSMSGILPLPYQSVYSGTKAFLSRFGLAWAYEFEGLPVSLTVFTPGGIATEMTSDRRFSTLAAWLAPADVTARAGIRGMKKRKRIIVPGCANKLGLFLCRFLPQHFVIQWLANTYKKALR